MFPLEDPFRGIKFPPGTTLELLASAEGTFTVTSWNGETLTFDKEFRVPGWGASFDTADYEVMNSPWDIERDRPLCVSDSTNSVRAYFQWFSSSDARFIMVCMVAAMLIAFASVGNKHRLWAIPLVAVIAFIAIKVSSPDARCAWRDQLANHRLSSGHILPVRDYRIVAPYGDVRGYNQALNAQAVPYLCLLVIHAILIVSIFPAIRGAHYVFVRHPVEPLLETRGPEDEIPLAAVHEVLSTPSGPPRQEFVEENQARRIEAQTKRIEAEAKLAEALLERERSRARWKRAKDEGQRET